MIYDILLKARTAGGYSARVLNLPECEAEGATREEALNLARDAIVQKLAQGEIVQLSVPEPRTPLAKFAGVFKDDPLFDAVIAEIEAYRRQLNAEAFHDAVPA